MIRKSGLLLVVIVPLLVMGGLYFFRNTLVEGIAELAISRMLNSEADLEGVDLQPFAMRATFQRLRIVDPDAPNTYLLEAGPAAFDLNGLQLFSKKLVIEQMRIDGLTFGRTRPGMESSPGATKGAESKGTETSGKSGGRDGTEEDGEEDGEDGEEEDSFQLDLSMPKLDYSALTREMDVDRVTSGQKLGSLQALDDAENNSRARMADLERRNEEANITERLSALKKDQAALDFKTRDPRKLLKTLKQQKAILKRTQAVRKEAASIYRDARAEPGRLRKDLAQANKEMDADIAAAARLANLGGLDVSQVGALLFGNAITGQFNWVLQRFQQVRGMVSSDGAESEQAARRAGRTISYPVTGVAYPGFLIANSGFSGVTRDAEGREELRYSGQMNGISSDAAVYGKPMVLEAKAGNERGEDWVIRGSFDHRTSPGSDFLSARGKRVRLENIPLGGGALPESVTSRDTDITLEATLTGDALAARIFIDAKGLAFTFAPEADGESEKERSLRKNIKSIFQGIDRLDLEATLGGTLSNPSISISSSIDEVFSRRMSALVGERVAKARRQIRRKIAGKVSQRRAELEKSLAPQREKLTRSLRKSTEALQALQGKLKRRR